jgi:hypothetical protein
VAFVGKRTPARLPWGEASQQHARASAAARRATERLSSNVLAHAIFTAYHIKTTASPFVPVGFVALCYHLNSAEQRALLKKVGRR